MARKLHRNVKIYSNIRYTNQLANWNCDIKSLVSTPHVSSMLFSFFGFLLSPFLLKIKIN